MGPDLIVSILVALLVAGVLIFAVRALAPHLGLPPVIVQLVIVLVCVLLILWLARVLLAVAAVPGAGAG